MKKTMESSSPEPLVMNLSDSSKGSNKIGSLVTCGLLLFFLGFIVLSYQLGIGTLTRPGPGLWPFFVSISGAGLSVVSLIKGSAWTPSPIGTYRWTHVMIAVVVVYAGLLPIVGYIPATVLLCLAVAKLIGSMRWISSIVTAIITPAASAFVFNYLLSVPLIKGILV